LGRPRRTRTPAIGCGGPRFVLVRCGSCCQSSQRGVASAYVDFDMPAICSDRCREPRLARAERPAIADVLGVSGGAAFGARRSTSLCHAGDRDRLLVRAHRRPAVAEHVRPLSAKRPPVRRQVRAAGCRERRSGEEGEYRDEQRAAAAVRGCPPVVTLQRLAHAVQAKRTTRTVDRARRAAVRAGSLQVTPPFQGSVVLLARMRFSIRRRYAPALASEHARAAR
jgi:hypothetical protein